MRFLKVVLPSKVKTCSCSPDHLMAASINLGVGSDSKMAPLSIQAWSAERLEIKYDELIILNLTYEKSNE